MAEDTRSNPTAADPIVEVPALEFEVVEPAVDSTTSQSPQPDKIKFESMMARDRAVAYLQAVVKGLEAGTLRFDQGDQTLVLRPTSQVAVQVKASRGSKKEKVSLEIEWRTGSRAELEISSG